MRYETFHTFHLHFCITEAEAASFGVGKGKGFDVDPISEVRRLLQHRKPPMGAQPTNHLLCRCLLIIILISAALMLGAEES